MAKKMETATRAENCIFFKRDSGACQSKRAFSECVCGNDCGCRGVRKEVKFRENGVPFMLLSRGR